MPFIALYKYNELQQSRFLAMVGNYERLAELTEEAANSEDAALIQQLKTMDSLQAKMNQLKVTFQEFYTSTGVEDLIKWTVDGITNIISRLNDMPKVFGKLPVAALATVVKIISGIKAAGNALGPQVVKWFTDIKSKVQPIGLDLGKEYAEQIAKGIESKQQRIQNATENALRGNSSTAQQAAEGVGEYVSRRSIREQATFGGKFKNFVKTKGLSITDIFGTLLTGIGVLLPENLGAGVIDDAGSALAGFGQSLSGVVRVLANPLDVSGWLSLLTGIPNLIDGIVEDTEEKIDRLSKTVEETSNQTLLSKNELKTLTDYKKKYEELSKEQYTSIEAKQDFLNLQNEIAEKYPELISGMTAEGTYLVNLTSNYESLYNVKKKNYELDRLQEQKAKISAYGDVDYLYQDYKATMLDTFQDSDPNISFWEYQANLGHSIFSDIPLPSQISAAYNEQVEKILKVAQISSSKEDFYKQLNFDPNSSPKEYTISAIPQIPEIAKVNLDSETEKKIHETTIYIGETLDFYSSQLDNYIKTSLFELTNFYLPEESFASEYEFAKEQIVEQLIGQWNNFKNLDKYKNVSLDKVWEAFYSTIEFRVAKTSEEITNNLPFEDSTEELKKINEIYSNPELYSLPFLKDFTENAGEYLTDQQKTDLLAKAEEQLAEAQASLSAIFENAFTEGLIDKNTWGNLDEDLIHLLRFSSQNLYENYLNQYSQILNSQNLSQQGKIGIVQDIQRLLYDFRQGSYSEEEYAQIEQIVSSADFLSYQGIFDLENQLEGLSFLKESNFVFNTEPFINRIIPNLVTESQTLTDSLASSLEGFEEALQKATSGMSFEEAKAMAEHLGISLKDFREQGGEFFLDNAILVEDYLTKNEETFSALKNKIETLEKHLTPEFDILEQLTNDTKFSEQEGLEGQAAYIQNLYGWLGIEEEEAIQYAQLFNQHYEEYVEAVANGTAEGQFGDYVRKELEDLTEEYKIASKASRSAILNTLLTLGDFNQFLSLLSLETFEGEVVLSKADRALIESGDFLNLSESGKAIFAPFIEQYSSSLQETRQEIIQQIQEKIFSENQDFITTTQANKNVLSSLASSGALVEYSTDEEGNITYKVVENVSESLWASALSAAGATTKEINELLVDFYENKNNEVDSSVAKHSALLDVIENIDNLTPEILESVANILNITIDEVISTYGLQANEDGTYDASQDFIQSLLSQFKIGVTSEIEDSLNDYLNNIISIASAGIEGSATNTEMETLQNYLNEQGQNIELKTFKTAEGLKLTEDSVYEIYYALSQINAVATQNLLEGISEQMEEWEGRGVDIATIYGKIGEAQKKIKDLEEKDPNDSRLRLAKAELATLQQIAKEKSKDKDNFDFMNKDLGDLNNPLTFYDSSAKAFEAIGEAASTGYMDIEAYVNMINFAADMYAKAGQNFEVLGMSASEAIQAGFAAIEGVDGEAKIKMSGLTFGTEELTEGMEFGIEEMAKSQIEWIDAQIAMLKGIETVQNLGELDKPTATNNVADFIDNYIGNFSSDENYQGLKKEIEILQEDADNWAEFCSKWQEILDKNDPATMEQEIIALFSVFDINLLEYIIPESEYDLVYNKVAEIFDPKNLYKKVVNADNAGETAEALAKSLGLNKEELLTNLQQAIEASGGSITAEELINLIVKNFEISQDELGNLVATIKINAEAGETIEEEDLLTRKEIIQNNKQQSLARGINSNKINDKTDNDKGDAEATVGTLTITAEKAVLGNENDKTEESGFDTIVPEGIAKTTTAIETGLTPAISSMGSTAEDTSGRLEKARVELGRIRSVAGNLSSSKIQKFANAVNSLNNGGTKLGILGSIVEQINKLPTSPRYVGTASASGNVTTPPSSSLNNSWDLNGNGIVDTLEEWQLKESMVKGNALAAGTLMGELGPELVVSGGRYYVVGQNGAEFVNLPSDAIVFNHLQTKRLLESGHINSTGDPVTNERNAVAWATGNVNGGPAMASASDVIAQLLELRAFWQGILEMSAQDFAKAGGGGKGGGGGEDNKAYVADLERWYNLLRQIANLEQKITLEQAKRQNMLNGYDYVDSLENELDQLKRQEKAYRDLSALQKSYYDTRRQDLLNSDYSKIFTYTSDGLMQYHEGENIGFDILAKLQETDANGQMKMNATEQLAYLESIGFDTSVLKVTKEGEDVDSETEMVQNFFDNVQAWMDELDGLYDSYNEALINVEEAITAQTAIQQEYIDNQLSLEQQVYTAIIDREQAAIDAAQDEIDAIQEAADNFISGLNDTLKREKDMYQTNNEQAETERLQRQLAILQRSGGSASEIRALEEQLESRYQDAYFDSMQDQIDAIQQASENQIEKLQEQVDIAVEALEYQKANGLLWNEVYEIMNNWDANAITQFVMEFTKAFKEQSTLQNQEQAKETQMSAEKWDAAPERQKQTEMWNQYFKQATEQYGQTAATNAYSSAKEAYDKAYQATEGTVEQKHAAGMAAAKIEFEKSKAEIDKVISGVNNGGGGNSSGETYPYGKVSEISRKETNVLTHEGPAIATIKYALKKLGYYKGEINEKYGTEVYNALIAFQKANKLNPDGIVGEETKKAFKLKGYSLGGLVDYTGLAMVHGTPQKPESYLNAEQTQELRNLLDEARTLNNVSHSIFNLNRLRQAWQTEFFNQISSKEQSHQGAGDLIFEDVDINITSGVINNQAEAAQLGRTMWNEFINVAKKTGNLTLSRR